jgi:hypothetical protein
MALNGANPPRAGSFGRVATGLGLRVRGDLASGSPHLPDHGQDIFSHPSTNRPTASLMGRPVNLLASGLVRASMSAPRPVDRGIKPPSPGPAPSSYS